MNNNKHLTIINTPLNVDYSNGNITGESVINPAKRIKDLQNIFEDTEAFFKHR